jgi:hypothetical protein
MRNAMIRRTQAPGRGRRYTRRLVAAACGLSLAGALAACGSSSSDKTSGEDPSKGGTPCSPAAATFMKPYSAPPATFPAGLTSLSKAPASGGTLIRMYTTLSPSDKEVEAGAEAAAEAAGWTAHGVAYDGTVADLQAKLEDAIKEKPTAILAPASIEPSLIQKQIDEAKADGILVGIGYITTPPVSVPGYGASAVTVKVQQTIGQISANWAILDSGCKANIVVYGLAGNGATKALTDSLQATVKANCSACKVTYQEVPLTAIGTPALGQQITSSLQAEPDANYLFLSLGNFNDGLSALLRQAGLQNVKVFGTVPDTSSIQGLVQKTNSMWINNSTTMLGWALVDSIFHALDSGQPTSVDVLPGLYTMTQDNIDGASSVPTYPKDYVDEWKKLWQVS